MPSIVGAAGVPVPSVQLVLAIQRTWKAPTPRLNKLLTGVACSVSWSTACVTTQLFGPNAELKLTGSAAKLKRMNVSNEPLVTFRRLVAVGPATANAPAAP